MNNKIVKFLLFSLVLGLFGKSFGQIHLTSAKGFNPKNADAQFFDLSETRKVRFLSDGWKVYPKDERESMVTAATPSSTEFDGEFVYEKDFRLSAEEITFYDIDLVFLGVNYTAEVLVNDIVVYKHLGGTFPFKISLPQDILKSSDVNTLKIFVEKELDSQTSIPFAQRFLFPQNKGGILRDVYFHFIPKTNVDISKIRTEPNERGASAEAELIFTKDKIFDADTLLNNSDAFRASVYLLSDGAVIDSVFIRNIDLSESKSVFKKSFTFRSPKLRSSSGPIYYSINCKFYYGDKLLDETSKQFSANNLVRNGTSISLNGKAIQFNGATYFENSPDGSGIISPEQIEKDLDVIKSAGFNSVRFAKHLPHPYALYYAAKIGLFTFVELPMNSMPTEFLDNGSFRNRVNDILLTALKSYEDFSEITVFGLGGSYLSDSAEQLEFINELAASAKEVSDVMTFASFIGFPKTGLENLDFIGVELYAVTPAEKISEFAAAENLFGKNRLLISEATYPTYYGSANGSLNKFSIEGQAKFIDDIISFSRNEKIAGFFINSMFDYKGDFASLFTSYDKENLYKIGILNKTRKADRITYKLIESRLKGGEKVTIPLGSKKDLSPVLFIILGGLLSVLMALLINSKRKFREDASRALLRPYNFFADIRDLRIFSGIHTVILMLIISATFSLLLTILLFHWKNNILADKALLAFNLQSLNTAVGYLAWHPRHAFVILFGFSTGLIFLHTAVLKFGSFFVKTRVLFSNIFYTVVWAFMPITLLLPLELILHRLLSAQIANLYIFGFILLFIFWLLQRMLKGIYVIFDVRGIYVYAVSFLFLLFVFGGTLFYFQLADSTIYYLINAFKQYQLL